MTQTVTAAEIQAAGGLDAWLRREAHWSRQGTASGAEKQPRPVQRACPTEHEEQVALLARIELRGCRDMKRIFAVPNGGQRHKAVAAKLRAEGVRSGVPDLFVPISRGQYHGLFIEMKRRKGGRVSPEQQAEIEALRNDGYVVEVCCGCEEAWRALKRYLSEERAHG